MSVPYEIKPIGGIVCPGGQTVVIKVKFPPRSFVSKLVVIQMSGSTEDFTVEMFNHANAEEGTPGSLSASDEAGNDIPLDCYRVGSPKIGTNGKLLYFSEESTGGHGLSFFCQDVERADRKGQVQSNLYIRIRPAGTGNKTFALVVGGESQISGV